MTPLHYLWAKANNRTCGQFECDVTWLSLVDKVPRVFQVPECLSSQVPFECLECPSVSSALSALQMPDSSGALGVTLKFPWSAFEWPNSL